MFTGNTMNNTVHFTDDFPRRHLGSDTQDREIMMKDIGVSSLDQLIDETIPASIRSQHSFSIRPPIGESGLLTELSSNMKQNIPARSYIGMGYYGTLLPSVIQRNILENPGWYTQYTPYQAEISQGRLEALLNFQTMVSDLTGLPIANASLLDEATAAAEAMIMFYRQTKKKNKHIFFVSSGCHPQTIDVLKTRAEPVGISVVIGDHKIHEISLDTFGVLVQYPETDGTINDYTNFCDHAHSIGAFVAVAADIMALTLLTPPGEFGADAAVGSTQRFGVPPGYGGPHAAYFSTTEKFKRKLPGRIIGVSKDRHGQEALRMSLQTREQHIRREKATSNICTSQVLLAIMAGMYAVYHGPKGLVRIAERIHHITSVLAKGLDALGVRLLNDSFFDTLHLELSDSDAISLQRRSENSYINFRYFGNGTIGISLDEATTIDDIGDILTLFSNDNDADEILLDEVINWGYEGVMKRSSEFLTHPVFNAYHSETEMLRYIHRLEVRDISLNTSMIPLGSCTMKLNSVTEMMPITWEAFTQPHPFAPSEQVRGTLNIIDELGNWLKELTGFPAVSMQPNSGAQGEYAGLMVIRAYHKHRGDEERNVCLIPASAHGTNPASAVMAGMDVVIVACDDNGNINVNDLTEKATKYSNLLSALMITYPSTHGVFEESIVEICEIIHRQGGQVYMDGANLNAMVGLCRPGEFGADVMHINLHKTFAIPHGGGGPGMGPIVTGKHLAPFLPSHPVISTGGKYGITAVSAAPFGSPGILPISWAYIALMNIDGLHKASQLAILNANYMAKKLEDHYPILYRGKNNRVAHEFIIDVRPLKKQTGITEEDIAKRLMDYGFHAPTMSFPVPGTLMIEPTESESKAEMDRFCDALIQIKQEVTAIETGEADSKNNVLKNAPHTAMEIASDNWSHPYSREEAAYPTEWQKRNKFWPSVARIDNAYGDRNLVCQCPPIEEYQK